MARPRIVFVQYTNPAAYPPLEHASRILADQGWDVVFLAGAIDVTDTRVFPPNDRIEIHRFPRFGSGIAQRLNYLAFILWVAAKTLQLRPRWLYASDQLACPAALAARLVSRCKVIYHEHDTPTYRPGDSTVMRLVAGARKRMARVAELCVLPQRERLARFVAEHQRGGPSICVQNCPRREEIATPRTDLATPSDRVTFYYHGSINDARLPLSVLDALSRASANAHLVVVGYETLGSVGYMDNFRGHAVQLGLGERVSYLGALSQRHEILSIAATCDVGLSFMPLESDDINMHHMAGASNKPFDYLAVGLMLLVSDLPEWCEMFVAPGYARACDPTDVESLATAMAWCAENPNAVREMGERGRRQIESSWNYGGTGVFVGFLLLGIVIRIIDLKIAEYLLASDWSRFTLWFLVGCAALQPISMLLEITSSMAAAAVLGVAISKYLKIRETRFASPWRRARQQSV